MMFNRKMMTKLPQLPSKVKRKKLSQEIKFWFNRRNQH